MKDIDLYDLMGHKMTITTDVYAIVNRKGFILQHDNAGAKSSMQNHVKMKSLRWDVPLYPQDLSDLLIYRFRSLEY